MKTILNKLSGLFLSGCLLFACSDATNKSDELLALVGGTVLDFDNYGNTNLDIENSVVLISGGEILNVGKEGEIQIPDQAKIIDTSGKFLMPGLIDAFATLNDQAYANAFLYMGVTTIVGLDGGRRGPIFWEASPAPQIYKFDSYYGDADWSEEEQLIKRWATTDEIQKDIDSLAAREVNVLLVHYGVKPNQLEAIVKKCEEHNIVTIGELGYSKIADALAAGVQSFVHVSRYSIDIVPESIKKGYKDAPFGLPRIKAYEYFENFDPETNESLDIHAEILASSEAALIPTYALWYPSYPFAKNPWENPAAKAINSDSIHLPVDKKSGKWSALENTEQWDTLIWSRKLVENLLQIEKKYVQKGAKYLTGSGTDAFGAMPGISLHTELEMLHRAGLTNRQALAAATTNFCKVWGWEHIGQIKPGSEADLLILSRNPVEKLSHLEKIDLLLLDGKILKPDSLLSKEE